MISARLNDFLGILLLLILIGLLAGLYLDRALLIAHHYGTTDFYKLYQSMRFYFAGQNIYSPIIIKIQLHAQQYISRLAYSNLNPPFFTLLLLPLCYLNYAQAFFAWVFISLVFSIVTVLLTLRAFPQWRRPLWLVLLIILGYLLYMPNSANFASGQNTPLIALLLTCCWLCARNNKPILAGIFLGLLFSIKIFLGLLLVYFILQERWRVCVSAVCTYIICFILGWLVFGQAAYEHYYFTLSNITWYVASWNASLWGFLLRVFTGFEGNTPVLNWPNAAYILEIVGALILIICLFWVCTRLKKATDNINNLNYFDVGFSLTLIIMLLLSPLAWIYYFALLFIPYLILVKLSSEMKYGVILHVLGCLMLLLGSSTSWMIKTISIVTASDALLSASYSFYALVLFLGLYVYIAQKLVKKQYSVQPQAELSSKQSYYFMLIYVVTFIPSMFSLIESMNLKS